MTTHYDTGTQQRAALVALAQLESQRAQLVAEISNQVKIARTATGPHYRTEQATWENIGEALGLTKQTTFARYKQS